MGANASVEHLQHENTRLRRAVEELSILNELAADIGSTRDTDEILRALIRRARRAVAAEEGVITLVHEQKSAPMETLVRTREQTSAGPAFSPDDVLLYWMRGHRTALVLNDPAREGPLAMTSPNPSIKSLLSVPMVVGGRLIGILTMYNKISGQEFGSSDARLLTIMAGQSAQMIHNANLAEQRERVVKMFGQHTSPDVVEELLRHGPDIDGRRIEVSIMFADVRGFSTYAEQTGPEEVVGYLNRLFDLTIDSVSRHHGVVHQLLGDGFMAIFGAPVSRGNNAENAVRAAVEMLGRADHAVRAGMIPPMRLGLGVHSGEVIAGMVGSSLHREYKITGDAVNVAARIQELNKQFDSTLLVSEPVFRRVDPAEFPATSMGAQPIRGRGEAIHIYRLI